MKKLPCLLPLSMLLVLWFAGFVRAEAPYRFRVEEMTMNVYPQPDAAARIEYRIVFANERGVHPIDIVDVGLPHPRYRIKTMSASTNDRPARSIRRSSYIDVGVEVDLGMGAIGQGETGTFLFTCEMPDMVYSDTTDRELASFQIRPTWFDPSAQVGTTKLRVAIHLPAGVKPEEVRYQEEDQRYAGLALFGEDRHVVAYWESDQFTLSSRNPKLSVSFPRRVMTRVVEKTKLDLLLEWFGNNTGLKLISGALLLGGLAWLFFRFSNGTGVVVFVFLAIVMLGMLIASPGFHLLCWPTLLGLIGLNEWYLQQRKKSDDYLPAMATVEGGGIKRGLTAPQAAVLLEMPLAKILTMVLFGLLKKEVVKLVAENPPAVEVDEHYRCSRDIRRAHAAATGVVLHDYEHPFLDGLQAHSGPVEDCDLNEAMGSLIKSVAERMTGFDLKRTREYYRRIVSRSWKEAESIGEIKQRDAVVERNFEWMMIDDEWADLFDVWRHRGYVYRPRWTRVHIPSGPAVPSGGGKGSGSSGGGSKASGPSGSTTPTLGEVAGSFFGWAETTTGRFAAKLEPSSMGLELPRAGVLDLSGVDRLTGDFFEQLAKEAAKSSSGGGGKSGGGGGCACACAGCACACACAGGGR